MDTMKETCMSSVKSSRLGHMQICMWSMMVYVYVVKSDDPKRSRRQSSFSAESKQFPATCGNFATWLQAWLKMAHFTGASWPFNVNVSSPAADQILAVPSFPAVRTLLPSGEKHTE